MSEVSKYVAAYQLSKDILNGKAKRPDAYNWTQEQLLSKEYAFFSADEKEEISDAIHDIIEWEGWFQKPR